MICNEAVQTVCLSRAPVERLTEQKWAEEKATKPLVVAEDVDFAKPSLTWAAVPADPVAVWVQSRIQRVIRLPQLNKPTIPLSKMPKLFQHML